MAPGLEENKNMRESVDDLQARLLQERHRREDVEVKVLALEVEHWQMEAEHRQMEAENQTLAMQLSHSADQQKGMIFNLVLLMLNIVRRLAVMCNIGNGARPFPGGHHAADCGEGGGRQKGREDS